MSLIYAILNVLEAAVERFIAAARRYDLAPDDLEVLFYFLPKNSSSNYTPNVFLSLHPTP